MLQEENRWLLQDETGSPVTTLNVLAEHVDTAVKRLLDVINNPENDISKEGHIQTSTKCKQGRLDTACTQPLSLSVEPDLCACSPRPSSPQVIME